jgi:hypothetical protein
MDTVAIETFAEWKLIVNAIQQNPPTFERDQVNLNTVEIQIE